MNNTNDCDAVPVIAIFLKLMFFRLPAVSAKTNSAKAYSAKAVSTKKLKFLLNLIKLF
jgi:hypothetical protein